ncbi:hypothetical protein HDU76_008985 [Blyttiomyces sp. JEL0837]|nr:hypothetical protein HDU76_008985 [Blyttiomyces sp. JEL0837]
MSSPSNHTSTEFNHDQAQTTQGGQPNLRFAVADSPNDIVPPEDSHSAHRVHIVEVPDVFPDNQNDREADVEDHDEIEIDMDDMSTTLLTAPAGPRVNTTSSNTNGKQQQSDSATTAEPVSATTAASTTSSTAPMVTNNNGGGDNSLRDNHRKFITSLLDEFLEHHGPSGSHHGHGGEGGDEDNMSHSRNPSAVLIALTKALASFGAPTHSLEFHMTEVSRGLGHPALFAVLPTYTLVTFDNEDVPGLGSQTLFIHTAAGRNLYKLQLVDELCRRVASYASEQPHETNGTMMDLAGSKGSLESAGSVRKSVASYVSTRTGTPGSTSRMGSGFIENGGVGGVLATVKEKLGRVGSWRVYLKWLGWGELKDDKEGETEDDNDNCTDAAFPKRLRRKSPVGFSGTGISKSSFVGTDDPEQRKAHLAMLKEEVLSLASRGPGFFNLSNQNKHDEGHHHHHSHHSHHHHGHHHGHHHHHHHHRRNTNVGLLNLYRHYKDRHSTAFAMIAVEDAITKLEEIVALPPLYKPWMQVLFNGIASAGCAGMFFGGGWFDVLISFIMGFTCGMFGRVAVRPFDKVYEFVAAFFVALLTRTMIWQGVPLCYTATTLSSCIFLLQGISITLAMVELATRNMIVGTSRLFYSLTVTCLIGFGLDLGATVASLVFSISKMPPLTDPDPNVPLTDPDTGYAEIIEWPHVCTPIGPFVSSLVLFLPTCLALCMSIEAHPRQFPVMIVSAMLAKVISTYTWTPLGPQLSSAIAAFAAGSVSNLYGRITGMPAVVPAMSALMMLVPGAMAVKGVTSFLGPDPSEGIGLVVRVLSVSLSLGMGLFLAGMVVPSIEKIEGYLQYRHKTLDKVERLEDLHF